MQLNELKISQLKQLAQAWNVTPTGDKRKKSVWAKALQVKCQELAKLVGKPQSKVQTEALEVIKTLVRAHCNYIPIYEYRARMSHLTRQQQDKELYRLQREDKIDLSTVQEVCCYTTTQLTQGIPQPSGGSLFFITSAA